MARRVHTANEKALAVARVKAGEISLQVATEIGVSHTTLMRWRQAAERAGTHSETTLAEQSDDIAARIVAKQEQLREQILDRMMSSAVQSKAGLKDLGVVLGILTDKALLAAGKPTAIHGSAIAIPDGASAQQLREVADDLRSRIDRERATEPVKVKA